MMTELNQGRKREKKGNSRMGKIMIKRVIRVGRSLKKTKIQSEGRVERRLLTF